MKEKNKKIPFDFILSLGLIIFSVVFLILGLIPFYPQIKWYLEEPKNEFQLLNFDNYKSTQTFVENETPVDSPHLMIPSIGVNMQIVADESDEQTALKKGAWLLPGTSQPNRDSGNTVIAGHRFLLTSGPNTFYHLDKVEKNDEIIVVWENENYIYRVNQIKIVEPTAVEILEPTDIPVLTLFTCHPVYSTSQRLVVIADLISNEKNN